MLTIKTNKNNCKLSYVDLNINSITTGTTAITIVSENHDLRENDTVVFDRKDGETISFFKEEGVNQVLSKSGFTVDSFGTYLLDVDSYTTGTTIMPSNIETYGSSNTYLRLNLRSPHIYTTNKDDILIRRNYFWDGDKYVYDGALTTCDGDYYLYDSFYLARNNENTSISIENITSVTITAFTVDNSSVSALTGCTVAVNTYGNDDRYHLYIPYDYIDYVIENFDNLVFIGDDIRFLHDSTNIMSYGNTLQPGTSIEKVCGEIEIDFGIGDNFAVNLFNNLQTEQYIEELKKDSINKIIDYERYQFSPMFYSGESFSESSTTIDHNLKPVNKIVFQLNFRQKKYEIICDENKPDCSSSDNANIEAIDFGTWETNDFGYWNNYSDSSMTKVCESINADLLGYLGYTDDDVYYQKDALKKSFIRLSFYDSTNRATQKLLYYSTIFFDTNKFSNSYIVALNKMRSDNNFSAYTPTFNQIVFDTGITTALTAEMECSDKYDDTLSSDGFYIHLYKGLVNGNTCTPIFMKVEFNNAKFGKTVPMIYPTSGNIPTPPGDNFPIDYIKSGVTGSTTYTWVDTTSLFKDMYIKLLVKYDYDRNEYVWFLPRNINTNDGTLTFQVFEPRIVGYDKSLNDTWNT